jgi:hypothetical protein
MDSVWMILKNTGIVMTFGAYHYHLMTERWKLHQATHLIQDERAKEMLERMKGQAKRKWGSIE